MRDDGRPHPGVEPVAVGQQQAGPSPPRCAGGVLVVIVSQLAGVRTGVTSDGELGAISADDEVFFGAEAVWAWR